MNNKDICPLCGEQNRWEHATCQWKMQDEREEANMLSGLAMDNGGEIYG